MRSYATEIALSYGTFVPLPSLPGQRLAVAGHVGIPGPQTGIGTLAVADWWLGMAGLVVDETEAAATPAKTTERAKMRMASFIVGNPSWLRIGRRRVSSHI
jgi:hypothetical protein